MTAEPTVSVVNIGCLLSGRLDAPVLAADNLHIRDGIIEHVGNGVPLEADLTIDVQGMTVAPGLVDTHCHVGIGDYTFRQNTEGFLANYVHGGTTQVVSPGEIHIPGRPDDTAGVKALAVLAQRSWQAVRPLGMKVHGGALIIEPCLEPEDMAEVAGQGVWLAKFGFGAFAEPQDGIPQVRAAQAAGIFVTCHSGGASVPGSSAISTDDLLALRPDVCGHINGGPTSLSEDGVATIVRETDMVLQIVQAGCLRSALEICELALEAGAAHRIVLGSDTPTGTGVMPLAMLRNIAELASLGGVDPAVGWAWSSGVPAELYGLGSGQIGEGWPADLCVVDAPYGSRAADALGALRRGDLPGIAAVLIDGVPRLLVSRNTPRPTRQVKLTGSPTAVESTLTRVGAA